VSVYSTEFERVLERHLTHWRLSGPFPRVIVEHPIQNVSPEALEERARAMVRAILQHLPSA
jgi:hypothetical protein